MAKKKPANPDQFDLFGAPARVPAPRATQPPLPLELPPPNTPPPPPPSIRPWAPRRGPEGALELADALRLECNLALMAGAGTGKTWSLITLCLHLLAGARRLHRAPLDPARLCLVTFTDKAAGELRARLRQRVDALAHGAVEPELAHSYLELELEPHPEKFWRRVRDQLGAATVGTFHGLCVQLVRRAPAGSGVNPAFVLLDERTASELLDDTVERVVLGALEAGDERVADLCREYDFSGGRAGGLVSWLTRCWTRIREEGRDPRWLEVGQEPAARAAFFAQLEETLALLRAVGARGLTDRGRERVPQALAALTGPIADEAVGERLSQLREALKGNLPDLLKPVKAAAVLLEPLYGAWRAAPYEATVKRLLEQLEVAHAAALERKGALDFTGLLVTARDLLRDHPEFRREVQSRLGALLVDEFQDTNRLQLELVMLLSEQRGRPPATFTSTFAGDSGDEIIQLGLEPGFLCAVGDRKQSIYEFRGADVSVFEQLAKRIVAGGGGRAWLEVSRRSTPELLGFFNGAFPQVMRVHTPAAPDDWEVAFSEHDRLRAHRSATGVAEPVVQLVTAAETKDFSVEQWRDADAAAIADTLAWLLRSSRPEVGRRDGTSGELRGGDVALLFRRFTQVEVYRQALAARGLAHRVVRGRGFFGAQEVLDLASLLAVVADPSDAIALAAVLRSPLVGLADGALFALCTERGLEPRRVLRGPLEAPLLAEGEREKIERFRTVWERLRKERDRLGLRALLKVALDETGYRTCIAAAPFGEQALANLDKLLELAGQRDTRGVGCAAFVRELLSLTDREPLESQGEVVDDGDGEAITLCTVHQAKGLEWPVVVVPELFARPLNEKDALRFDPRLGLALKPPLADGVKFDSLRHKRVLAAGMSRARAEEQRLFYVALTRARDRLVLGLTAPGQPGFAALAQQALTPPVLDPGHARPSSVEQVDPTLLQVPRAPPPPSAPPDAAEQVARLAARVLEAPLPRPNQAVLPVTQLQDFVLCPRRYRFAHGVGLAEQPRAFTFSTDDEPSEGPAVDPRVRGIAAHRLLELTPLEAVGTPALRGALEELARLESLDPPAEVFDWVERFWKTKFGLAMKTARVHRELPFVLRLDDGAGFSLFLRGQLDLLVESGGVARVVDYKTAKQPPAGLAPYAFQLGCYALAAAKFLQPGVEVQTGIAFLREADPSPRFMTAPKELDASLARQARALVRAQLDGVWPGHQKPRCEELGCGYVYRCHPG